jgi:hypothetical protein
MARAKKNYRLFANGKGIKSEWLRKNGESEANAYKEVSGTAKEEDYEGSGKTPSTTTGLTAEALGALTGLTRQALVLASGEQPRAASLHFYGKAGIAGEAAAFQWEVTGEPATMKISGTTVEWRKLALSSTQVGLLTRTRLESSATLTFLLEQAKKETGKPTEVSSLYAEVETETEVSAPINTASGRTSTTGPLGGGVVEVEIAKETVGNTLLVAVQTTGAGGGATGVADAEGNTFTLDKEAADGSVTTVQLWRAPVTKGSAGNTKVKVTLPANVTLVEVAASEWLPIVASSPVDASGTGTGIAATAVSATTTANLRATQGDLLIGVFGSTANSAAFTAGTGMTALTGASQTGASLGWGYFQTPTEGAAATAEGTFAASGTWAGLVVAYEVLAASGVEIPVQSANGVSAASLALHAPTAIPMAAASGASVGSLSLSALTAIPVAAGSAVSLGALALQALTRVVPEAAGALSAGTVSLGAPTGIAVATASASVAAVASLGASTRVVPEAASGVSVGAMQLGAPTGVLVIPASAGSAASLSLGAATQVSSLPAGAASEGAMQLRALTGVVLQAASGASAAQMVLAAPAGILVAPASAVSLAVLTLGAPTRIVPQAASAGSLAALALSVATQVPVGSATGVSGAAMGLSVEIRVVVLPAFGVSAGVFSFLAPSGGVDLPFTPASATSATALTFSTRILIPVELATAVSAALLGLLLERYPTLLVAVSRSPTTLVFLSRSPTALGGASRAPSVLASVSRSPVDLVGVSRTPTVLEPEAR